MGAVTLARASFMALDRLSGPALLNSTIFAFSAAASFTSGSGANNLVQFRTAEPLTLDVENRFVTFSVDAVAMNWPRGSNRSPPASTIQTPSSTPPRPNSPPRRPT